MYPLLDPFPHAIAAVPQLIKEITLIQRSWL